LISPTLDVVQSVKDNNIFVAKYALHRAVNGSASILLRGIRRAGMCGEFIGGEVIDGARYGEGLVGDEV
jgi:hypothetical protein